MKTPLDATGDLSSLGTDVRLAKSAFESAVESVRPDLWRYCHRLTGSIWDAEDLVQDTLTRAFARLGQVWQPTPARPYLFRIATNLWIDQVRRRRPDEIALDNLGEIANSEEPAQDISEALERLVRLLPPVQRVVFLLTQGFRFTAGEAATMLNTTEGAVRASLHRARTTLHNSQTDMEATDMTHPLSTADSVALETFLAAFRRKDPDLVASVLADDVHVEIVGVAEEFGRQKARASCLNEWSNEWTNQAALSLVVDGQPVVVIFEPRDAGRVLVDAIRLEPVGSEVGQMRIYYFCPDLLRQLADSLGMGWENHGYVYQGGGA